MACLINLLCRNLTKTRTLLILILIIYCPKTMPSVPAQVPSHSSAISGVILSLLHALDPPLMVPPNYSLHITSCFFSYPLCPIPILYISLPSCSTIDMQAESRDSSCSLQSVNVPTA